MPDFNKSEIKSILNKAKGGTPINYAFGLAGKPEECGFLVHKTKAGKKLGTELKAEPGISKVGYGTIAYDGSVVTFTEERPVKGLVRMLTKLFRNNGLALKLEIAGEADGDAAAADGGDAVAEGGADAGGDGAADPAKQAEREKWVKRMASLEKELDDMLKELA